MLKRLLRKLIILIKGGFLFILVGNILSKSIAMLSSIVIARMIDKSEFAYLSYADNLYSYLMLLSGMGLSSALLKYCGVKNEISRDKAYFYGAITQGVRFELLASLLLCIAVTFLDIPYPRSRLYMWMLCLYPPLTYLYSVFSMYLRTQYENLRYALGSVIQSSAVCIFSIVFLLTLGISGIVVARYVAVLIVIVYFGLYLRHHFYGVTSVKLTRVNYQHFIFMGLSLMIANFFSGIMPINEAFLVNNIIQNEVVTANFRVAGIFPSMLLLFGSAITVYYFPIISQMNDWKVIRKSILRAGFFAFFFIGFVAVIGIILTPWTISLLYGDKYLDAIPMAYMLWGMRAMNCCIRIIPMNLLPAIGKVKFNVWMAFLSCVAQVVIDYFMILTFGISGVVWGAILVYGLSGVAYWIYILHVCKKNINMSNSILFVNK